MVRSLSNFSPPFPFFTTFISRGFSLAIWKEFFKNQPLIIHYQPRRNRSMPQELKRIVFLLILFRPPLSYLDCKHLPQRAKCTRSECGLVVSRTRLVSNRKERGLYKYPEPTFTNGNYRCCIGVVIELMLVTLNMYRWTLWILVFDSKQ